VPSLFVIRGNDQGVRFELDESPVRVGRDASSTIQLHDTEVSRQHAEIRWHDRTFSLVDLGSSNGTFLRLRQSRELKQNDLLLVGQQLLRVDLK